MANGIKLHDGRIINADFVALISIVGGSDNNTGFSVELSNGTKLFVSGDEVKVRADHRELRRAIGVPDENMVR